MKTIILLLFISTASFAQVDTGKLLVRLQFTQDHIAAMGSFLADERQPFSKDNYTSFMRINDTLALRIGTGTKPDSVTIGSYPVNFVIGFFSRLTDKQAGSIYSDLRDIINGKSGYIGILQQLNTQANDGNKVAAYLRKELIDLFARKQAVWIEEKERGKIFLLN
jgi:hypothetical protein